VSTFKIQAEVLSTPDVQEEEVPVRKEQQMLIPEQPQISNKQEIQQSQEVTDDALEANKREKRN